ncbi:MAG: hypothetical protein A2977_00520 [Alphaproteobacteria bacterium RIFCSPLOWO2_01_FULL_45_8]|nr:MAG: hypothetical protein A2065_00540 [Alphaproteobacteria bacterium GWB1_45_5]OFW76564.1 MAG: hypothetical protein A3K20_00045 [Alphaproteobacteria bacterium GWA1_45_9]OFW89648.1 MAG: hypothetical protein A2621_01935 [Alphaproteobacteria bacterium RIFCSPHIGHO2_01_FULL_41_14]OFW96570.1 MAG: hypothetical protein A2977_00520 [Alphaproteobacteria bacterium RIFCSPLOWO2_01_FULL_45_8]HCI49087.1 hypothetical protein [Holosporales bacterium]
MTQKKQGCDALTELVFLEQLFQESDGEGGLTSEWRPVESLWVKIEAQKPGSVTERWQGERPHFAARYWVWIRQEQVLPPIYRLRWEKGVLTPLSAMTCLAGEEWQMVLTEQEEVS